MATEQYLKVLSILDVILEPIHKAISAVLPDFIEEELAKDEVRRKIVDAADKLLIKQYPPALLIPEKVRKAIIRYLLDCILGSTDEIVNSKMISLT